MAPQFIYIPASMRDDISGLKSEINGLKECTQNILKAILEMSKKVKNNFESIHHKVTALSRQINGKDLIITESLEQCKITNQTAAILEKVKRQGEYIKTITKSNSNIHRPDSNKSKDTNQNVITEGRNSAEIQANTSKRMKLKKPTSKAKHKNNSNQNNQNNRSAEKISQSLNVDVDEAKDYIDRTKGTKKNIKQTKLQVDSSILLNKNIRHLLQKIDELRIIMANSSSPDVLGVCETFLEPNIPDNWVAMDSCEFIRKDRSDTVNKTGGGLVIYIWNTVKYVRRTE